MKLDASALQRYAASAGQALRQATSLARPPTQLSVALFGIGNSGEALTLRIQALGYNEGEYYRAFGLNNDKLAPRPLPVRQPDGKAGHLELTERLVMHEDNSRDLLQIYPLLERRYRRLLRGISVFETYPRPGHGGHGHPVISALDMDLHSAEIMAFLRRALREFKGSTASGRIGTDWSSVVGAHRQHQEIKQTKRILVMGGGAGSMGNAAHHLLPYLIRQVMTDLEIHSYELWGVVLGPRAFTGLTPFIRHNYRALMLSLDHMARHGQQREYINDLTIYSQRPPYDRVLLLDDTHLPGEGARVTEAEQDHFLDRAALGLYLLLRGNVWETVASFTTNPDATTPEEDVRPRYLHTVQGVAAGLDRGHLTQILTARLQDQILQTFVDRLAA